MSQETGREQRPASPRLALAGPPVAARQIPRPLEVAECAMCGIALPLALLVPDGGQACADIGWYCKDVRSCTERWTTALPSRHAYTPADHGNAGEDTGEVSAEAAPAKPLNGMLELAAPA